MNLAQKIKRILNLLHRGINHLNKKGVNATVVKTFYYVKTKAKLLQRSKKSNIFGHFIDEPLVSIICVNFNGEADLPSFLDSILELRYENFELIVVDNCSVDSSLSILKRYASKFRSMKIVELQENVGFAQGNNIARESAVGDLYALINIDTTVDINWLTKLVQAMQDEVGAAAVTSKIVFYELFRDVEVCAEYPISIDLNTLSSSLNYKKYFIRTGLRDGQRVCSNSNGKVKISIPIQSEPISLKILFGPEIPAKVDVYQDNFHIKEFATRPGKDCLIELTQRMFIGCPPPRRIINNAGSFQNSSLMPQDRGFGEYDFGQYDNKQPISFFCGCSVLIRRSAIINRPIFVPEFFAYYEDSELSRWFTKMGYKIIYEPSSVVYHKHSATSSEGSPVWKCLVSRSQGLYMHSENDVRIKEYISKNNEIDYSLVPSSLRRTLEGFDKDLRDRLIVRAENFVPHKKSIGIYNSYWNTFGGGESHVLSFIKSMPPDADIYLISETDFSIVKLAEYFQLDLSRCKKIVTSSLTSEHTKQFDLFINSTFGSNLISRAKKSFYVVSFPHKFTSKGFLKNYYFLYNSQYTRKWAEKYWGSDIQGEILYPVHSIQCPVFNNVRKKVILSVGRFFPSAHSKNQKEIILAFQQAISKTKKLDEWTLVMAGSLNLANENDLRYFNEVKKLAKDLPIELLPNLPRNDLNALFNTASLYVHASGYAQNPLRYPENFEHFGIAVLEAMCAGCIPIVYSVGGPSEIVETIEEGCTFSTLDELTSKIIGFASLGSDEIQLYANRTSIKSKKFIADALLSSSNSSIFTKD